MSVLVSADRFVFMSDGSMMDHDPLWSPEWWHHETFHILEHLFPETPFSKLSDEVGHPCFLRDRWPQGYSGLGECDFYYWSLRLHCLEAKPTLAERLGRRPGEESVSQTACSKQRGPIFMCRHV